MLIELLIIAAFASVGAIINYFLVKAKKKTLKAYKQRKTKRIKD